MKVSILVPIYGVEKYIRKCAKSLFEQSYENIEYIFVNDCTPDDSINILQGVSKKYPERGKTIQIVSHEINKGLAASRLTGIAHATGDYLMFVDSDDYLEVDAVELLVNKVKEADYDIVTGGIRHIFDNGKNFEDIPCYYGDSKGFVMSMLMRRTFLNVFPRIYKRELINKLDQPFIKGLNYGEDYMMTSRVFYYAKEIAFVDKSIYNYIHTNSLSYTYQFKIANFEMLRKVVDVISNFYEKVGDIELIESHKIGKLKLKSEQLIMFLRSKKRDVNDYNIILNSYYEDQHTNLINQLPKQDKIILKLSGWLPKWALSYYVRIGYQIKQILKSCMK